MRRIKERSKAGEAALLEILTGRKADPAKGIKAFPRLHSPTARWHTKKVLKRVASHGIDSALDEFLKHGGWDGWE